jgi:hypothetical protein
MSWIFPILFVYSGSWIAQEESIAAKSTIIALIGRLSGVQLLFIIWLEIQSCGVAWYQESRQRLSV